jgi:hypothetical protein
MLRVMNEPKRPPPKRPAPVSPPALGDDDGFGEQTYARGLKAVTEVIEALADQPTPPAPAAKKKPSPPPAKKKQR